MRKYLETLLLEKNISFETPLKIEGKSGTNFMSVETVVDAIVATSKSEQGQIRNILVQIDFKNGDIMHFIKHLAQALAI